MQMNLLFNLDNRNKVVRYNTQFSSHKQGGGSRILTMQYDYAV